MRIEMVRPHESEVAAGAPAVGWPGVAPRCVRLAFRVGRSRFERLPRQRAERFQVILPAFFQIRVEPLHSQFWRLVDVTVGDGKTRGPDILLRWLCDIDGHGRRSLVSAQDSGKPAALSTVRLEQYHPEWNREAAQGDEIARQPWAWSVSIWGERSRVSQQAARTRNHRAYCRCLAVAARSSRH